MGCSLSLVWDNSRVRDDIARSDGKYSDSDITDLGSDVFQIDTRMAGYAGITAGYLIRGSRPCLVETGTSASAPVVRAALTALGKRVEFPGIAARMLQRLLDGPATPAELVMTLRAPRYFCALPVAVPKN